MSSLDALPCFAYSYVSSYLKTDLDTFMQIFFSGIAFNGVIHDTFEMW